MKKTELKRFRFFVVKTDVRTMNVADEQRSSEMLQQKRCGVFQ